LISEKRVERKLVEAHVDVTPELRADMQSVCEYLDEVADDPDVDIDYDDAIQIGSLCGGRINRRKDLYLFTYYLSSGDDWMFEAARTILDGIADGSISRISVTACVPE
jgi:hypothetical protein